MEKQLLNFYKSSLSNKLIKLLFPLDASFGINMVLYTWITKEGNFFQIGNHPNAAEEYFSNRLYLNNPTFSKPENFINNHPFFWDDVVSKEAFKDQEILNNKYGFRKFFFIPKIKNDSLHLFCFSSKDPRYPLNTIACQNQYALSRFADFLIDEWMDYYKQMENYTIPMGDLMGKRFFEKNTTVNPSVNKEKIKEFGWRMGFIDRFALVDKLTRRERDCIELLLKGKMANQIGEALDIDKRTVFHYLDNVKNKLGCSTKTELIEILQEYKNLGLL